MKSTLDTHLLQVKSVFKTLLETSVSEKTNLKTKNMIKTFSCKQYIIMFKKLHANTVILLNSSALKIKSLYFIYTLNKKLLFQIKTDLIFLAYLQNKIQNSKLTFCNPFCWQLNNTDYFVRFKLSHYKDVIKLRHKNVIATKIPVLHLSLIHILGSRRRSPVRSCRYLSLIHI